MSGTRAPARDSSLRDRKAPGNVSLTHPAAPPAQCNADGRPLPAMPRNRSELALGNAVAAVVNGLAEFPGHGLDALGRRVESGDDGGLRRLVALGIQTAGILQGGVIRLHSP